MMDDTNGASPAPGLSLSSQIPIAQISPTTEDVSQSVVHATVSLLWPYSSSTKSLSLLLAEPDFRLRRSNGQVKIVFNGHIAERVAASKIGIGDDVHLYLEGARFVNNDAATQTPGKYVPWDLHFDDRVQLEVFRNSEPLATVKVNPASSPVPSIRVTSPTPVTPTSKNNSTIDGVASVTNPESWQSPAFMGRNRTSFGALVNSAFDPFAEEDGYVPGKGRKRARFSMRASDWRVIDEPESPGEKDMPIDWFHIFDEEEAMGSDADEETTLRSEKMAAESPGPSNHTAPDHEDAMEISEPTQPEGMATTDPAPTPAEPTKDDVFRPPDRPSLRSHFPIDTPRLHPIPSPGLPIPSPLITTPNNQQGYFGSIVSASQSQIGPVSAMFSQELAQQSIDVSHILPQAPQFDAFRPSEIALESAHLGQDTGPTGVNIAAEAIQFSEVTATTEEPIIIEQPAQIVETAIPHGIQNGEMEVEVLDGHELDAQDQHSEPRPGSVPEMYEDNDDDEESQGSDFEHSHKGLRDDEGQEQEAGFDSQEHRSSMTGSVESKGDDSEAAESVDEPNGPSRGEHIDLTTENRHLSEEEYDYSSQDEDDEQRVEDEEEKDEDDGEDEDEDEDEMSDQEVLYGAGRGRGREIESDDEDEYESEYDSDEMSVEDGGRPPPPRTVHPEVIVLDSDSEDDTPPNRPTLPTEHRQTAQHDLQSDDEDSVSGESYTGSEGWPDANDTQEGEYTRSGSDDDKKFEAAPGGDHREHERVEPELEEKQRHEAEMVYDSHDDEPVESGPEEQQQMRDDIVDVALEDERVEPGLDAGEQVEIGPVVPSQDKENLESVLPEMRQTDAEGAESDTELVGDQHIEAESLEHEGPEDELVEERPINDEHEEDEQIVDAHLDQIINTDEAALDALPEDNKDGHGVQQYAQDDGGNKMMSPGPPPHQEAFGHGEFVSSIDQIHATSEPLQHDFQMAIDPELYNLGPLQDVDEENQMPQQYEERFESSAEATLVEMERQRRKEEQMALTMDGASAPSRLSQDQNDASDIIPAPLQHGQQFMTPELSQSVDVNNDTHMELITSELPPTPLHKQEAYTQEKELPVPAADAENPAAEQIGPDLDGVPENTNDTHVAPEKPHESVEMPMHEPEKAPSTPENQARQNHIVVDDDDSIDTIDSVHLVSVDRNYPGLRSKLSYFAPLATLIDHFNSLTDTISVVSEARPVVQATNRSEYFIILTLTDPSMAGTTLNARISRHWKGALPSPEEGDAILLRNFTVRSFDHTMVLMSGDTSSWAVFSRSKVDAQVDGPPVEYGAEEQTHATDLRQWYQESGMGMVADFQLQASIERGSREVTPASSAILSDSGSIDSVLRDMRADSSVSARSSRRSRKSHRRITIHELRDGTRYTEVGSPSGKDSIHELRDGTVYANI